MGAVVSFLACDGGTQKPDPEEKGECVAHMDCLKKRCPQENQADFRRCLQSYHSTDGDGPKYVECEVKAQAKDNLCVDLTAAIINGKIDVAMSKGLSAATERSIAALRHYIFPSVDLEGKAITCQRLKEETEKNPAFLMEFSLGRFFPARTASSPFDTPIANYADTLPLLFSKVPTGTGHIVVVQAFCRSDKPRDANTVTPMFSCLEGLETKEMNGQTNYRIPMEIKESICF
jgi:hypothetical protein